jgi:hypothetical protein
MVIEDHFSLPEGFSIIESGEGNHLTEGYYRGDYSIRDDKGEALITYERPVYIDAKVFGMPGVYNLIRNGNEYALQTLIPIEWLRRADHTYPLMIDPIVNGVTKRGDFRLSGASGNMGFTSLPLGSCDYNMSVTVPGNSLLTNAYVDLEYQLTYNNTCGTPPLPPPFCTFSQVTQEIICNACSTSSGILACNPVTPPFTGTCTTDPNLVPGANAVLINSINPTFFSCIPPQCPSHLVTFTLRNRDSICGDVCGYLCARGNMWQMTVEARTIEGFITPHDTIICPGDSVIFAAHVFGGVPPYTYLWCTNGVSTDTIYNNPYFLINPNQGTIVDCIILDNCGNTWLTNLAYVSLISDPPVISLTGDTLISSCTGCSHQWFLNDTLLAGDTLAYHIAMQFGTYKVWASDSSGCQSFSEPFSYAISSSPAVANNKWNATIIPNPSDGNFTIRFAKGCTQPFSMRILDAGGKLIATRNSLVCTNNRYTYHPEKKMAAGIYFIEVGFGNEFQRQQMVVIN